MRNLKWQCVLAAGAMPAAAATAGCKGGGVSSGRRPRRGMGAITLQSFAV